MKSIAGMARRRDCFVRTIQWVIAIVAASTFACSHSDTAAPILPPSADCIDYSSYIHTAGSIPTGFAYVHNVLVHEGLAYVIGQSWESGDDLEIFDLTAPDGPAMIGRAATDGGGSEVAVVGSRAYVATWSGLFVIDVSEPTAPSPIATIPGYFNSVSATDSFAFVTHNSSYRVSFDVVNPAAPAQQAIVGSLQDIRGVVRVRDRYAFIAGDSGIKVIDVSNPRHPVIAGALNVPGYDASDMVVSGRYAYATFSSYGLHIVDISTPARPVLVGTIKLPGYSAGLALSSSFAYVACSGNWEFESALCVVDVSDPANPRLVWKVKTDGYTPAVAVAGSRAYVAGDRELQVVDISTTTENAITGRASTTALARDIALVGSFAYVAESSRGLTVFDVSGARPRQLQNVDTPGSAVSVAVSGWHAYVADAGSGLQVIGLSNGSIVGSLDTPGRALAVAVDGSLAVVADGEAGVQVIDISTPTRPVGIGRVDTEGSANDVAVAGGRAYIATGPAAGAGLAIVDITEPASARLIGTVSTPVAATSVGVFGGHACVAGAIVEGQSAFYVIDVASASIPAITGELMLEGYAGAVALDGRRAYVAGGSPAGGTCVWVVDISNPATPTLVGCMQRMLPIESANTAGSYGHGIALSESRAFVVGADLVGFALPCQ